MYETFVTEEISIDGFKVLVGGICLKGCLKEVLSSYKKINELVLYQSKDIYMIDYILAEQISRISPSCVVTVGATIHIEGVELATGGVIGSPFEDNDSADGLLEKINDDIYMVAAPGNLGIAYIGEIEFGKEIEKYLLNDDISQENSIKEVEKMADEQNVDYFIVSDGCGNNRKGMIITKHNNEKKVLSL